MIPALEREITATGLGIVGAFHPEPGDLVPDPCETLLLLGPAGPEMWDVFSASAEARDGAPDPMDRWSRRVISELADRLDGRAYFPFGGPPWQPFQRWAERAEGAVSSPVGMQASATRGLWVSYRGAIGLDQRLDLAPPSAGPCAPCPAPCLTACPVDAFASGTYDVPRCVGYLNDHPEAPCHRGCLVRVACPAGSAVGLPDAERAFHMAAFLRANSGHSAR